MRKSLAFLVAAICALSAGSALRTHDVLTIQSSNACELYNVCEGDCPGSNTYTVVKKDCNGNVIDNIYRNFARYDDCVAQHERDCNDPVPAPDPQPTPDPVPPPPPPPEECPLYNVCQGGCPGGNMYTVVKKNCHGEVIDNIYRDFARYDDCVAQYARECQ